MSNKQKLFNFILSNKTIDLKGLLPLLCEFSEEELNDLFSGMIYKEKPVDIETFIKESPSMQNIYPFWIEQLKKIYPEPYRKNIDEVIITGAIGIGKTLIPLIGLLYEAYLLSNLCDSVKYFGLVKDTKIVFGFYKKTKTLSCISQEYIKSLIENSPFIKIKNKVSPFIFDIDDNIQFQFMSQPEHLIGNAIYSSAIELDGFFEQNEDIDNVIQGVYNRMKSRFQGNTPFFGTMYVTGNSRNSDLIESRINKIKNDKDKLILIDIPVWKVKEHLNIHTEKYFRVDLGDKYNPPRILKDTSFVLDLDIKNILKVPEVYREQFEKNLIWSIKDLAGFNVPYKEQEPKIVGSSNKTFEEILLKLMDVKELNNILNVLKKYLEDKE